MSNRIFLSVIVSMFLGLSSSLQAKKIFKRYPVESGMIFYDINITGKSNNGFKTHTSGIARLVFDKWGAKEVKEEDSTEIQSGDYNETHNIHSLTKIDDGTVYTVDYDEQAIYKTRDRSMDLSLSEGEDLSNENLQLIKKMKGIKIGEGKVAGFPCDIWKAKDQKICLYQGIPLSITIDNPGFHSERKAVHIAIDLPIPKSQFKLPNFPITVDDDYRSNISAQTQTEDYVASIHDLQAQLKDIGISSNQNDTNLSKQQEKKIINILGARYLKKQKRLLPKLLVALKSARECISKANKPQEAKRCIEPVNKIDEALGDKTENFDYIHIQEKRDTILSSLDKEINYLKITNKCVQEHNSTSDVVLCTEGNLGGDEK